MKKPEKPIFPDKWSNQPLYFRQWTLQEVPHAYLNHIDKYSDNDICEHYHFNFTATDLEKIRKYQHDNWYLHNICEPMNLDADTKYIKIRLHNLPYIYNDDRLLQTLANGYTLKEIEEDYRALYVKMVRKLQVYNTDMSLISKYKYPCPIAYFMTENDVTLDLIIDKNTYQLHLLSHPYENEEGLFPDILEEIKRELTAEELKIYKPIQKFIFDFDGSAIE